MGFGWTRASKKTNQHSRGPRWTRSQEKRWRRQMREERRRSDEEWRALCREEERVSGWFSRLLIWLYNWYKGLD